MCQGCITAAGNRRRRWGVPPCPWTQISQWQKMKFTTGNIDLGYFWCTYFSVPAPCASSLLIHPSRQNSTVPPLALHSSYTVPQKFCTVPALFPPGMQVPAQFLTALVSITDTSENVHRSDTAPQILCTVPTPFGTVPFGLLIHPVMCCWQGRMYISKNHICFYSPVGPVSRQVNFKEVANIQKKTSVGMRLPLPASAGCPNPFCNCRNRGP